MYGARYQTQGLRHGSPVLDPPRCLSGHLVKLFLREEYFNSIYSFSFYLAAKISAGAQGLLDGSTFPTSYCFSFLIQRNKGGGG